MFYQQNLNSKTWIILESVNNLKSLLKQESLSTISLGLLKNIKTMSKLLKTLSVSVWDDSILYKLKSWKRFIKEHDNLNIIPEISIGNKKLKLILDNKISPFNPEL